MARYLRDVSKKNNWQTTYDQPTNYVTVRNPDSGRTLSFKNGQGQEYGFGGLKNDQNTITDINKLTGYLNSPQSPSGTGNPNNVMGANTGKLSDLLTQFDTAIKGFNTPYDPTTDPVFQEMSKRTTSQMLQDFGSRGLVVQILHRVL